MSTIPKEVFRNVRRIQIRTSKTVTDVLAGAYHSAFKGRGMEFEEVREYTPGDEVRSIDWNVTARMNHPYVKSFREERELTVMLAIDVSASTRYGSCSQTKSEYVAELGAVLAFSAIQNNDKVGLILFSDHIEKYLPPKKGTRHVLRVIRELLVFEPQGTGTDVKGALAFLGKVQRKKGVCFVISDFLCPEFDKELAVTSRRHDLIGISIEDPQERAFPNIGLATIKDLETGEERLIDTSLKEVRDQLYQRSTEHRSRLETLMQQVNAGFISLNTQEGYVDNIRRFLRKRELQR
jgi:uncharacterized protein (DUF58 family)